MHFDSSLSFKYIHLLILGQETTGVDLHEIKEEEQLFTQFSNGNKFI